MKTFIYGILFLLISIAVNSCRMDTHSIESGPSVYEAIDKNKIDSHKRFKSDLNKNPALRTQVEFMSKHLPVELVAPDISLSKTTQDDTGYTIYTDVFDEVSYLNAVYHTFLIIAENSEGYEQKLVIKSVDGQIVEKYLFRYKRLADISIDHQSYQTFKLQENTSGSGQNLMIYVDVFSMGCSTYTIITYNCGYTGNHTNGQYCSVTQSNVPLDVISVSYDPSCHGDGDTGGGGGGGGGGGTPSTPPVITIPTSAPLYTTAKPRGVTCNPLGLSSNEIISINSNDLLRLRIYQYLAIHNSYPLPCEPLFDETQLLIRGIITYVEDHPGEDFSHLFTHIDFVLQFLQEEGAEVSDPLHLFHRLKALDTALAQNPNLLLDIPCNQLPEWYTVANHQVPQSLKNKLNNIQGQTNWWNSWQIQNIDNAAGPSLNMDLFSVRITSMPFKPNTNVKYTPAEFFDYFRKNINTFVNPDYSQFFPIVEPVYGINDTNLWNSTNPLGALVTIIIPGDEGTVMCTGYNMGSNSGAWVFTTVKAPIKLDGVHPVSGHRLFGYWVDSNGFMYLFTRGVDRFTKPVANNTLSYLIESYAFSEADKLWKSMQTEVSDFVNKPVNGGLANKLDPEIYRPAYMKIRNYLKGSATIQSLGCN